VDILTIAAISVIFFAASVIGVSTGGITLVTVPALMLFGLSPQSAVATNMFAIIFMCLSGIVGFRRVFKREDIKFVTLITVISIAGSFVGAMLLVDIDENILKSVISILIICVVILLAFVNRDFGVIEKHAGMIKYSFLGYPLVFVLGIYSGFFGGAYITLLSSTAILFWGHTFIQVAAITKVVKIFAALIAVGVFMHRGLVDFRVAPAASASMLAGGYLGAHMALSIGNRWVKKLYLAVAAFVAFSLVFI